MASDADSDESEIQSRFLILMRHAKSDWGDPSRSDHDRSLNARGQRDAPRMAQWLSEIDLTPETVLSSTAARTRETLELMRPLWLTPPTVSFRESLYLASPESIIDCIRGDGMEASCLMVLAHNPGMSQLASLLAGQQLELPTAAIAIFEVELHDWSQLQRLTPVQLVYSMRPKAL